MCLRLQDQVGWLMVHFGGLWMPLGPPRLAQGIPGGHLLSEAGRSKSLPFSQATSISSMRPAVAGRSARPWLQGVGELARSSKVG